MNHHRYIYLHGFASGPYSAKAQYLKKCYSQYQINLVIPDLNLNDFSHLTLTRQIVQVQGIIAASSAPVTLIGSSFGGLTAAFLGEISPLVQNLILLAPAFNFRDYWFKLLSSEQLLQWQHNGYLKVYHYGFKQLLPLHYQFLEDLQQYDLSQLQKPLPTLICHGLRDEVIPIAASRNYQQLHPWVDLQSLDSDHSLTAVLDQIWLAMQKFSLPQ